MDAMATEILNPMVLLVLAAASGIGVCATGRQLLSGPLGRLVVRFGEGGAYVGLWIIGFVFLLLVRLIIGALLE